VSNPNYPVIEEQWGASWTAAGGTTPAARWVNLVDRTLSQASARRGKQYELDQPQAGEYGITLGSQDGALDPTNAGGPYGGKILPYQPYRRRAQWPPTANMLDPLIANGGEGYSAGSIPSSFGITGVSSSVTATIATPTAGYAWQGSNVFSFALASNTPAQTGIFQYNNLAVRPGKTVTLSLYIANTTAATTAPVTLWLRWLAADGSNTWASGSSVTITGASGSPAWQRITVTATAPTTGAYTYGMRFGLDVGSTPPSGACTLYVDGIQLEWASSASAWVSPGTWYPIFTGFTERWPTTWADGGTYGQVALTAVDTFALLSQVQLKEVFLEEIESHSPRFCYGLNDPAGVTSFADMTGNLPSSPVVYSKAGTGNWTSGNSVSAASATGGFTGSTGTVVHSAPSNPGSASASSATMLDLTAAGISGPESNAWTRMVAFRCSATATSNQVIWDAKTSSGDGAFEGHIRLYLDSGGWLRMTVNAKGSDASFGLVTLASTNLADGNWHLVMFGWDPAVSTWRYSVDGVQTDSSGTAVTPMACAVDAIGALWNPATRTATNVYAGDLAFVTEFPSLLASSDMTQLYTTWRNSATGESSASRYARILRYSGYAGTSNVGTGLTTAMGPADNLSGTDVVSALNDVVTTENGEHFVAADGTITFRGRGVRYNALSPAITFGDGSGEMPYEDVQLDFDPTHLGNVVEVTQTPTGTVFAAQNSASVSTYYTRTMTRSLNTANALECQDAADYLVSRYSQPLTRVQALKVHPSAVPSLWPTMLALELGTRVRINRRPPGAPLVSVDCFVEQIQWDMDDKGDAFVTLQCSPIDPNPYAGFAAWHTTLGAAVSAGANTITVNAPADNVNPLAAQLTPGQQLVVGLGGSVPETMTILSVSSTGSPWTTGTITFTANLAHGHTNGFTVSEALPTGITNPAYYDATEQFGKAVFAY
jgi:hypothetical protein